ncbi:CRISPR-associated RAMP family protein [Butyricicoccus porcorum]|uniref:CRISPR-associated RAMP family protein n=2 Tax=Butyricicoccus porcorum TaxID=1945634 RepID=A0A252F5S7_9FIRM|nr:CRISPR-associated RAMP family protein [Butyricicoccus porcorum]
MMAKNKQKESEVQLSTARAPYNFIPLINKVAVRYNDVSELPHHDVWYEHLLSGNISITITVDTPMCVANGLKKEQGLDFFQDANGNYTIPGSSLRGMIRTNMQILGLGKLRAGIDFDDHTVFYRDYASASSSKAAQAKEYYTSLLGVKSKNNISCAERVHAGYLHCRADKDEYYIHPCKGEKFFRVNRSVHNSKWEKLYAGYLPIYYSGDPQKFDVITPDEFHQKDATEQEKWREGVLLSPGQMKNQNSLYIFPQEDTDHEIAISPEQAVNFKTDWEARKNGLPGTDKRNPMDPEFWALPKHGKSKPVFYIPDTDYFGMSQFLRIPYAHALSHGLPQMHQSDEFVLDYPNAVLGFSEKDMSYRSRVSFDDMKAPCGTKTGDYVDMILGGPKPSFYPNYTVDGIDYNQDNFQLRGIKQYWLKEVEKTATGSNKQVGDAIKPVPVGTKFTGTIHYQNLAEDELGLLLWCLRLEDGCYQQLGKAKPYGYGRVKLQIDALHEYNPHELYHSLSYTEKNDTKKTRDRVEQLICAYDTKVCELVGIKPKKKGKKLLAPSIRTYSVVQDFMYMKRTIRTDKKEVSYLSIKEHKNVGTVMPTVHDVRNEAKKAATQKTDLEKKSGARSNSGFAALAGLLDSLD